MDNKAHAVLTVLFARAMQARFMPTRLTNSINHRCLVEFALSGNLHIIDSAPCYSAALNSLLLPTLSIPRIDTLPPELNCLGVTPT